MSADAGRWRSASLLSLAGGAAFWVANFAISLTPIAADYRAGLDISYLPMLVQALVGGLILGFGVSYCLLRYYERIPARSAVRKSLLLGVIALVAVTVLVEVPAKYFTETADATRYFLIGLLFNAVRILALAVVIGYLFPRVTARPGRPRPEVTLEP